jgi:pimeloyl-ACP methyl ester carboxylesterase
MVEQLWLWAQPLFQSIQALRALLGLDGLSSLKAKNLLVLIGFLVTSFSSPAQVFDIAHVDSEPTRTLLLATPNPKALVLLYPGGGGMLRLQGDGSTRNGHTFVRSKDLWAQYGIDAVLVDTPYDLGDLRRGDMRGREEHLQRVNEVIDFYRSKLNLPIWIFGHSMGTSTVSNFLNGNLRNQKKIEGAIIAGTIRSASIDDDVTIPLEAIHHFQDSCLGSLPENSKRIIGGRPKNLPSKLVLIDGGISEGNECEAFAYHGFNKTEPEFIDAAAQFILSY